MLTPEITQWLIYAAVAVGGYLLRHYHIAIPGLPQSPTPVVTPAAASPLLEILKLLEQIKNPASAPAVSALSVSTPTHNVEVGADGTSVTAK